jgi:transposase-like protein
VYLYALMVKMGRDCKVDNRAVYTAIGWILLGKRQSGSEIPDVGAAVIEAVLPSTLVQTCIMHLIRASLSAT